MVIACCLYYGSLYILYKMQSLSDFRWDWLIIELKEDLATFLVVSQTKISDDSYHKLHVNAGQTV